MRAAAVRLIQQSLVQEGYHLGEVDGKLGQKTYGAVETALAAAETSGSRAD